MSFLKKLSFGLISGTAAAARGKEQARAYAVGDIHGRLDLLNHLLDQIEADIAARPEKRNFLIFLGDLIDRGPESAGVVDRLMRYQQPGVRTIFLAGNHEEVLLRILEGDVHVIPSWLRFGGAECAQSYGINPEALKQLPPDSALNLIRSKVPPAHKQFLESFADTFSFGDYLFVHAGIRPGIAIEEQSRADLRWIREPFLNDAKEHGCVVVHGHTIVERVEERTNRIGIDTGAYRSGNLTALAIEDEQRWFLSTGAAGENHSELHSAAA